MSRPDRVVSRVRAAAAADGADRSGLAALRLVHALQAAGDALIAVALAGTVFFDVPLGQARGRVALYLLLTLLPFALLVPVAGPLLDRFRHGRRTVLSATTGGRGLLAWSMAGSLASLSLYPQALAVLVLTRAYGVARSAAVVRVRPPALGLVAAGARLNIAATAGSGVAAAVGVGLSRTVGSPWSLRLAALLLLGAALAAQRLPAHVDEIRTSPGAGPGWRVRPAPDGVRRPLLASVALRAVGGLLTVALAFLLRAEHTSGPVIGVVLGAALAGSLLGTVLAGRLPATTTARLTGTGLSASALALLVAAVLGRGRHRRTGRLAGEVRPGRGPADPRPGCLAGQRIRQPRNRPTARLGRRSQRGAGPVGAARGPDGLPADRGSTAGGRPGHEPPDQREHTAQVEKHTSVAERLKPSRS